MTARATDKCEKDAVERVRAATGRAPLPSVEDLAKLLASEADRLRTIGVCTHAEIEAAGLPFWESHTPIRAMMGQLG